MVISVFEWEIKDDLYLIWTYIIVYVNLAV